MSTSRPYSTHRRGALTARPRLSVRATSARSAATFGQNGAGRTRDAFPDGIRLAIRQDENDHRQPFRRVGKGDVAPRLTQARDRSPSFPLSRDEDVAYEPDPKGVRAMLA